MTKDEAITALNAIENGDSEIAHGQADDILLAFLKSNGHPEVALAWESAQDRATFWYA